MINKCLLSAQTSQSILKVQQHSVMGRTLVVGSMVFGNLDMENDSGSMTSPTRFSGEGKDPTKITSDYESWKASTKLYFGYLRASGVQLTKELELCYGLNRLSGSAALAAQDAYDRIEKQELRSASWSDVIAELDKLCIPVNAPQMVLGRLGNIKQSMDESVDSYAHRWMLLHRQLDRIGASNRDIAVHLFISGLRDNIRSRVMEKVLEDQVLNEYAKDDVNGALVRTIQISKAREHVNQHGSEQYADDSDDYSEEANINDGIHDDHEQSPIVDHSDYDEDDQDDYSEDYNEDDSSNAFHHSSERREVSSLDDHHLG